MSFVRLCLLFSFIAVVVLHHPISSFARPQPNRGLYTRQSSAVETACNDIFSSEFNLFTAELVHDCLISTPFNATVATQFLSYYKDTLQFQSTLAYLKNPPSTYKQPSVDLLGGLDSIQQAVDTGFYKNEYDFEAAVQKLVYAAHDAHITLYAGALSVFTFGAPVSIVSVSTDGIAYPKVFILDDLLEAEDPDIPSDWEPSAIVTINGVGTADFLKQFASKNSPGTLELHTDWNHIMSSPAADIQNVLSPWEGNTPFWPGNDLTFGFENGTEPLQLPWVATYSVPDGIPPITSGAALYRIFVLGDYSNPDQSAEDTSSGDSSSTGTASADSTASASPSIASTVTASADPSAAPTGVVTATAQEEEASQPTGWDYFPYPPNPVTVQPNLGFGGVITGYFLNDDVTAVLSIPSFDVNSEAILTFSDSVGQFIRKSKEAGKERMIIDLQRNGGGGNLLATDIFKQFFPSVDPFGGSRLRAHDSANVLGNTFSAYYESQRSNSTEADQFAGSVWTAQGYLNAETGRNFSSWAELYGPHQYNGDLFTTTQRDNLSSVVFDQAAGGLVVSGFANRTNLPPQPYDAKNIVLLSDGICSSACANFVEMMHHQAGVRTVVVGGLPEAGPMQIPAGSRGAEVYSSFALDLDITFASTINATAAALLPQDRDIDFYITYAGFNIRDAVRKNDHTPLQFYDLPADCRIFYTVPTVYNLENLWNYVIDAMWRNPSLCIAGSATPFAPSSASNSPAAAPAKLSERSINKASSLEERALIQTFENDVTFTPSASQCTMCANARERCTDIPYCDRGQRTTMSACRRVCAGPGDCAGSNAFCTGSPRQRGYCQETRDVQIARSCPSRSRGNQPSTLVATSAASGVGRGPYEFPTSGRRPANNRGRGGIPTSSGSGSSRPSSFGAGGMVNFAFGRGP
ncbi:MAG: hypothetical protein Q9226_002934 [Calogaya cf. arnoldii]